jgi:hypothetical protein
MMAPSKKYSNGKNQSTEKKSGKNIITHQKSTAVQALGGRLNGYRLALYSR